MQREISMELAKRINMPYLFIKAKNSSYFEAKANFDEVLEIMEKNDKFKMLEVAGKHHLHLTHPEKIASEISEFLGNQKRSKL